MCAAGAADSTVWTDGASQVPGGEHRRRGAGAAPVAVGVGAEWPPLLLEYKAEEYAPGETLLVIARRAGPLEPAQGQGTEQGDEDLPAARRRPAETQAA